MPDISPEVARLLEAVGAIVTAAAGIYLLTKNSVAEPIAGGQSWFEVLAHGFGIYFIGRGVWMFGRVSRETRG